MRLFLGIPLTGEAKEEIGRIVGDLKGRLRLHQTVSLVKWASDDVHLTVRFLGDVPPSRLDDVIAWATAVLQGRAIGGFEIGRTGYFESGRRLVLWVGLHGAERIADVAIALSGRVADLDAEDRDFIPHLTIGRAEMRVSAAASA